MIRPDPNGMRIGSGLTLLDRPAPGDPSLQVGDRWNTRTGPITSTLALDGAGVRVWLDLSASPGGVPALAPVLAVGNTTGPNPILVSTGQRVDAEVLENDLELGTQTARNIIMGTAFSKTMLLGNQGGMPLPVNSNAGIQWSSLIPNRGAFRGNQWGNNAGIAGVTGFKSRGLTVGSLVSVNDLDVLFRATAIGVAGDNASIPLAGYVSIQVPPGGAVPGRKYVAADFAVELTPLEGPINGHREVFKINSQGVPALRSGVDRASGIAVLDAAGVALVLNANVTPTSRFQLSVNEGTGTAPSGQIWQQTRVPGVSFTIRSTANAADEEVAVFWVMWEPLP